jgi:collagen type III alpha
VNLEYAKKATGLVIQRLKDQIDKGKVDQKLLDKLGWNRDDLLRFVRRWDKMYQDAQRPGKQGAAAQQELDDALRSLGLSRDRIFQRAGRRDDSLRQMRESFRSSPPPEYQQQLRAYLKGTARTAVPAVADRLP